MFLTIPKLHTLPLFDAATSLARDLHHHAHHFAVRKGAKFAARGCDLLAQHLEQSITSQGFSQHNCFIAKVSLAKATYGDKDAFPTE